MSMTNEQLNTILDFQADLDWAISEGNWKKGYEIVFAVKDLGYEHESKMMLDSLIRAQNKFLSEEEVTFEPVEDSEIPYITPEEDDAPVSPPTTSEYAIEYNDEGRLEAFKK